MKTEKTGGMKLFCKCGNVINPDDVAFRVVITKGKRDKNKGYYVRRYKTIKSETMCKDCGEDLDELSWWLYAEFQGKEAFNQKQRQR